MGAVVRQLTYPVGLGWQACLALCPATSHNCCCRRTGMGGLEAGDAETREEEAAPLVLSPRSPGVRLNPGIARPQPPHHALALHDVFVPNAIVTRARDDRPAQVGSRAVHHRPGSFRRGCPVWPPVWPPETAADRPTAGVHPSLQPFVANAPDRVYLELWVSC